MGVHLATREIVIKQGLFIQGPSIAIRAFVLLLASVALMTVDHRYQQLEQLRGSLSVVLYPAQYLVNLPGNVGGWVLGGLSSREALQAENRHLRGEMLLMRAQLQKYAAVQSENERLRRLLMSSQTLSERVLVAELLTVDMDPFSRQILLNKGNSHGVYVGQSLLDANGVVGQITHVGPLSSTALMITDASHSLPVQVNRTGLRTVANGTGGSDLELMHVSNSADLREGDLVVTSGLGGRFPAGYPVARVTRVTRDPSRPFARVQAIPLAKIDRLREVMLVWSDDKTKAAPVPVKPPPVIPPTADVPPPARPILAPRRAVTPKPPSQPAATPVVEPVVAPEME